jgi:hypothetical protein
MLQRLDDEERRKNGVEPYDPDDPLEWKPFLKALTDAEKLVMARAVTDAAEDEGMV